MLAHYTRQLDQRERGAAILPWRRVHHGLSRRAGAPLRRMLLNISATPAGFDADLIRLRMHEGMVLARAKGRLRGKQPKLSEGQQKELRRMHDSGDYSICDLAELFSVSRPTVYRTLQRQPGAA